MDVSREAGRSHRALDRLQVELQYILGRKPRLRHTTYVRPTI
jgi:hypothetical protein